MLGKPGSKLLTGAKLGLGLSAWAASVMAIFIPLLSEYGIWMALILAIFHGLLGGIVLPSLAILTNLTVLQRIGWVYLNTRPEGIAVGNAVWKMPDWLQRKLNKKDS